MDASLLMLTGVNSVEEWGISHTIVFLRPCAIQLTRCSRLRSIRRLIEKEGKQNGYEPT